MVLPLMLFDFLCRADEKEGAGGAEEAIRFSGKLVALKALNALLQVIIEALLFFGRQCNGESFACTQIMEVQLEVLARVKLAVGLGIEQLARSN